MSKKETKVVEMKSSKKQKGSKKDPSKETKVVQMDEKGGEEDKKDPIRETRDNHRQAEEILSNILEKYQDSLGKKVKEDADVVLKGYDFVDVINLLMTLKDQ